MCTGRILQFKLCHLKNVPVLDCRDLQFEIPILIRCSRKCEIIGCIIFILEYSVIRDRMDGFPVGARLIVIAAVKSPALGISADCGCVVITGGNGVSTDIDLLRCPEYRLCTDKILHTPLREIILRLFSVKDLVVAFFFTHAGCTIYGCEGHALRRPHPACRQSCGREHGPYHQHRQQHRQPSLFLLHTSTS